MKKAKDAPKKKCPKCGAPACYQLSFVDKPKFVGYRCKCRDKEKLVVKK